MGTHLDSILESLPEPQNRTQLILQSHHRSQLNNLNVRSDSTCKKCLTQWTAGQFQVEIQSSNHKRKRRRQHQIERLQKAKKSAAKRELTTIQRQIQRLQEQNNHVAIYKCDICKASTRVQLWKPKLWPSLHKQDINGDLTAAKDEQHKEITNKPKKNKGKKKKTAGLIIPPKKKAQDTTARKQLSMAKISNMFQQTATKSQMSKLNQFLK